MITLITGAPGAGKSSYLVSQLMALRQRSPERPLFVGGVPDLAIDHEVLPPVGEWVEASDSANGWRWRFPEGAVLVLDEAQSVFRPRASGAQVPPHVAALEVHRHQGLDVYLCTQAPALIDSNVRRLVGRHVHLRATWAGRRLLEWSECVDPSSRSERTAAVSRPWRLPRSAFSAYRSASVHVKQSRRIPWQVGLLVLVLAGLVFGGWHVYGRLYGDSSPYVASDVSPAVVNSAVRDVAGSSRSAAVMPTPEAFIPRVRGRPETAPLYDDLRKVQQLPVVVGCVSVADRCTCYTQQATDAFVDLEACREWIKNPPFQPFTAPKLAQSQPVRPPAGVERSEATDEGGGWAVVIEDGDRLGGSDLARSERYSGSQQLNRRGNNRQLSFPRPGY